MGLILNGIINKSISGLIDDTTLKTFKFDNPCGDLTANTNTGDTTILHCDNNTPQTIIAINSYLPPTGTTYVEITFNFTVYDENIASNFNLELLIPDYTMTNTHKYKQTYKIYSSNQICEYSKTFYLKTSDLGNNNWNSAKNITFKFTGNDTNKEIYLFTNKSPSTTANYTIITFNIQVFLLNHTFINSKNIVRFLYFYIKKNNLFFFIL